MLSRKVPPEVAVSYIPVEAGYGRVLILAMEHDFPAQMEEWKKLLKEGKMTHQMRDVFQAMGYPVPRQRKEKQPPPPDETVEEVVKRESDAIAEALRNEPPVVVPDDVASEHGVFNRGDASLSGDELRWYEPGETGEGRPLSDLSLEEETRRPS